MPGHGAGAGYRRRSGGASLSLWGLGFKQSSLGHIVRALRHGALNASEAPTAFPACSGPLPLSRSGKPGDPGTSLQVHPDCVGDTTKRLTAHTVHAVLPHTAHRRRSPPAFGFSLQGFPALCGPSQLGGYVARPAQPVRPPPTPTRPAIHFPGSPVIGRHAPMTYPQVTGPGRASPVPAATLDTFRAPYAGESLTAALPGCTVPMIRNMRGTARALRR